MIPSHEIWRSREACAESRQRNSPIELIALCMLRRVGQTCIVTPRQLQLSVHTAAGACRPQQHQQHPDRSKPLHSQEPDCS